MTWDSSWEDVFKNQNWGKYPPEELVRFISRTFPDPDWTIKILDLGCGTGACLWYLAREKFSVYGIDGSPAALSQTNKRLEREGLKANLLLGDFTMLDYHYKNVTFDCVIDVCSLQHNTIENIQKTLDHVLGILKPGGKVFSMLVSNRSSIGQNSPFKDKGFVHLSSEFDIGRLFSKFRRVQIETSQRTDRGNLISHYVVMGEK